ncbi:MAG TPA: pilus assembly protein TadG-related protein [Solirubrobacteraceae bacterium]|nr:pilus assembly protein TadG-related protein [Solirubrobacteraceae bacterium]
MLVITAISMVAMLGMTALVVDVGSWYQVKRQAQDAADAAALAGAADLPSSASTATTDAQTYGNKNMNCTSCTTVTTPYGGNSSEIQATVTTTAPSFFGHLFGITSAAVTEKAVAEAPAPSVSGPIFANSTNCSAVSFTGLNDNATLGGIVTDGGINFGGSNSATIASIDYNSSCGVPSTQPHSSVDWSSATTNSGTLPFPVEYRAASQTINCNGNGATVTESGQSTQTNDTTSNDTYTYSQSSLTFSGNQMNSLSGIYCANSITLSNSAALSGNATFIANSFSGGQSDTGSVTPADGSLLMWQTGSSQLQIDSTTFINNSVIFAPYAQIYLNSNAFTGGAQTTLLEGNTVEFTSMNGGSIEQPTTISGGGVPELIG